MRVTFISHKHQSDHQFACWCWFGTVRICSFKGGAFTVQYVWVFRNFCQCLTWLKVLKLNDGSPFKFFIRVIFCVSRTEFGFRCIFLTFWIVGFWFVQLSTPSFLHTTWFLTLNTPLRLWSALIILWNLCFSTIIFTLMFWINGWVRLRFGWFLGRTCCSFNGLCSVSLAVPISFCRLVFASGVVSGRSCAAWGVTATFTAKS